MTTAPAIDLAFPVIQGLFVPIEHGHQLLGAIKEAAPQLAEVRIGVHSLRGSPMERGLLHLRHREHLRLRLPGDRIAAALPLAGRELRIGSMLIRLGVPSVEPLAAHAELYARSVCVAITAKPGPDGVKPKHAREATEAELLAHVRARCNADASVRILRWRTVRLHGKGRAGGDLQIRAGEVVIEGLDDEHSLAIQSDGIGGRRAFGCGIFVRAGVRKMVGSEVSIAGKVEVERA